MSESDATPEPAPAKSPSSMRSLVLGIVGIAAIIIGITQMTGGLGQLFGGTNKKISALLGESDAAIEKGRGFAEAADAAISKLLEQLNTVDLATLRGQQRAEIEAASQQCAGAAEHFRRAAKKLGEALALGVEGRLADYLKLKSAAFQSYAKAYDAKGSAATAVLDDAVADPNALISQVNAAVEEANKAFTSAELSVKRADDIAKELQPK
jgi:hypothetical protein